MAAPEPTASPIVVSQVVARSRFEARADGELVGLIDYVERDGHVVFVHTEVPNHHGRRGVESSLTRGTLDLMREAGTPVVPQCAFTAGWIDRHPDYADLLPQ